MFATTFHSPAFNFAVSPSHTELENIQMDWTAKAFGLPEQFLLCNSGGGVINNSATESVFISIHAAKHRRMEEL
jgi:aromatic-L-amino-acid decarboxylase